MGFTPLGDALQQKVATQGPLKRQIEVSLVIQYAEEVFVDQFGHALAHQAKPLFLKNRTLTVTCANATIAQEIRLHQTEIVDKINLKLGKKEVDRIRYLA